MKLFTPTRKQQFIFFLVENKEFLNFCDKNLIVFSDVERALGYRYPQPDLRGLLSELEEFGVFTKEKKERHGYWTYKFNKKVLLELIYNSKLTDSITGIIHQRDKFAIT